MAREVDYIEIVARANGQQELRQVGGIIDELMRRAQEAGVGVDDLTEQLRNLNEEAGHTNNYDNVISKFKQIASIAAIGMGIKKSINIFTAFDDVARRVQGTTGANAETMELLRYQAKELGRTTSWSASEAAEAQFEFAKAGFTTNEILAATGGILDTATASQMGLAEATEITAGALRMFGLDASKSTQVGDMLTKTASSTTTDVRDLAEALKYSGNGARQFGLDLQQTLGILGKLGDRMLKGSEAGTGLQAVFASLLNSKKASMLVDIGVNLTEDGSYRNILDIIDDIKEKTSNMEEVQRLSLIQEVFGDQGSRVMNNILALEKDEIKNLIKEIENSSGFSQELANTLNAGLGGSFRNLTSATEGLAIAFGEYLEPTAISLINATTQLISAGTGEGLNTDYLISGSGKSSNGKIKHNGYYLKGTSISTQNYNIDNRKIANNSSNENNLNSYQSHTYSSDTKKVITNFSTQDNSNSYQSTIYNSDNRKINNNSSNEGNKIYTTTNTLMNNKTIEEKILDALLSIKNLLSSKGEKGNNEAPSNSQIIININKGDNINDIVAQVVEDLTIALANI